MIMKKSIIIALYFIIGFISFDSGARIPTVWSVYGTRLLSDDDESYNLLHRLAEYTGKEDVDLLNTLALIEATYYSDGALSEILGGICVDDFKNKTKTIIYIFDNFGPDKLELYIQFIAYELYLEVTPPNAKKYYSFDKFVASLNTTHLNSGEMNVLTKLLNSIKREFSGFINR